MTAEQLLTADLPSVGESRSEASGTVEVIRSSWAVVEPQAENVGRHFYATLFSRAPETRDLFPVNMEVQRSRLLRALVHVVQMVDQPDDLVPFLEQLGRDHRKFGVLTQHYDAVGFALVSAIREFADDAWTPQVDKAWNDAYRIVADAMRTAAQAERGPASWLGRVVGHERKGWDLAVITVQTSEPIPYRAGQYLSVETPQRPRLWRYLSPANAPRPDGTLEFHVRAVNSGWVSRAIVAHSRVGDTWRIGPPMGRMSIDKESDRDLLMIAGGTGMAPLKALLEDLAAQPKRPRTQVFVGGRSWEDLYDFAALRKLSYSNNWLDVIPVVESDEDETGAEHGTLADVVTRYGAWADHDVLVCGSPSMIRATVSRMLVAGTPLDRIRYDPFTMD
ncbi:flavohemoprotein [Pseudonocardia sp. KRD-184]|uniref:Flavohemoprotein n=1 Tax=Pseudonocardia oceani TaxID=2792013 RepID=A0ABS6UAE6_9PSEU|nr:globin domain-containing protein [Pseudonocardia oceani]MBW0092115.1 flavohemoprotein [Pseudonocardia oceani]MBW0100084.1 flavohemoprotein [Pseudonocardia oceani]MBW0112754.1 flavohemoprotein [Pseudonocardia oceani]MBW0124744.1 flavohemoprotein [Pseudonocardia oceani]MBW0129124.1 flavohemoprotein [Pseudonocardia oceani]